jgi:hypothetical protein
MKDIARSEESGMMKKGFIIRNNALSGNQAAAGNSPEGLRIKIKLIRKIISGRRYENEFKGNKSQEHHI